MPLGHRSKGWMVTENRALFNERENEKFFCLLNSGLYSYCDARMESRVGKRSP